MIPSRLFARWLALFFTQTVYRVVRGSNTQHQRLIASDIQQKGGKSLQFSKRQQSNITAINFQSKGLNIMSTTTMTAELVNVAGASNVALSGYDPVAFFTDSKPVNGDFKITATHCGATYYFANKEHKALFAQDPDKYAPQNGGFCTFGVSVGALFPVDINTWQVHNERLYLNLNPDILQLFNKNLDGNIAKAAKKWPDLVMKNAK